MKPFMEQAKPMMQPGAMQDQQPGAEPSQQAKFKTPVNKVLPPDMQEPFERVVLAGKKVLYSEQMQPEIQKLMADPKPIEQKLAEGVRGLMGLLSQQSKPAMPPQIIIPAGIELLHEAADFAQQAGLAQITPEQMTDATQYLAVLLAKGAGASDDQVMGMFSQQGAPQAGPQAGPEQQPMGA